MDIKKKLERIDHDFKRLGKGIRIMMREDDANKRELIGSLLFDESDRLREDMKELLSNEEKEKDEETQ